MKTILILAFLTLCTAFTLNGQAPEVPQIVVTGTVSETLAPDLMRWRLQVTSRSPIVRDLAAPHAETVRQVLTYLKEAGIDRHDISTSRMQLEENWEWEDSTRHFRGYIAKTDLRFCSTQLDDYDRLWVELSEINGVSIDGVSLDLKDRIAIRKRLRVEALKAARQKAEEMAAVLGEEINGVLYIAEDEKGYGGPSVGGSLSVTNAAFVSLEPFPVGEAETGTSLCWPD